MPNSYRLYNDSNDLYLLAADKLYKYNATTGSFNVFHTYTNSYIGPVKTMYFLNIHNNKFYYYDYALVCPIGYCDRHYFYNGTSLDSVTFYSGPPPSIYQSLGSVNVGSNEFYFTTLNYVYKSDYTAAGTTQIYSMPISSTPDLIFEHIDDIKSYNGNIYIVEYHEYFGYQTCYLRKFDGNTWSLVDSSNSYITMHRGKEHLFYTNENVDTASAGATCKIYEITGSGIDTLYSGNLNSRFFGSNIIGSIKDNIFVEMGEQDTTGNSLFSPRAVVCKVNHTGITPVNISTYQNPMPFNPESYWISSNSIAVSNDTVMYFVANDTTEVADSFGKGNQVWVTDGTNAGTHKISVPGSTHNNDLYDAFYFNRSVGMCRDNVYFIFDPDGAGGVDPQCWQGDRYGHANFVFTIRPDSSWYDFYMYQNIASNNNKIFILADTVSGIQQVCLYRNQDCSSINSVEIIKNNNEITFYPNPTTGILTIETSQNGNIEIMDLLGRIVHQSYITNHKTQIDIGELSNGVYIARFTNKDGTMITNKLLKE